jgi:hypothetical protein
MVVNADLAEIKLRLQQLEDREAIRELIYYKGRATDRADSVAEGRAFTAMPYADRNGPPEIMGDAEQRANAVRRMFAKTHHQIGNILIDLRGDEAFTETYCTAFHRTNPTAESNEFVLGKAHLDTLGGDSERAYDIVVGLRYLEHFQKADGKWSITSRRLVFDWTITGVANNLVDSGLYLNSNLRGERKPDDPSYQEYAIGFKDLR